MCHRFHLSVGVFAVLVCMLMNANCNQTNHCVAMNTWLLHLENVNLQAII